MASIPSMQIGQHSPSGMSGLAQSVMSSQITSSHMTVPLSHTQIRQGSGFHTSLSLYDWPSNVQLLKMPTNKGDRGEHVSCEHFIRFLTHSGFSEVFQK